MKKPEPTYSVNTWTRTRNGWRSGTAISGLTRASAQKIAAEQQSECSHEGPCRFPFKQCDGGICVEISTD